MTDVYLNKCRKYNIKEIEDIIKHFLNEYGWDRIQKFGKRVLIKPNLLTGVSPDKPVTTHPLVFEAVVKILKEEGFDCYAGDSPAVESTSLTSKKTGIKDVCDKYQIPLIDFKKSVSVSNPKGKLVKRFKVAEITQNIDWIFTLPKFKTHVQMYYTGALKNMFGVIPGIDKSQFHVRFLERNHFSRMIVDLNLLLNTRLALMDGIIGMQGNGPQGGDPVQSGFIGFSDDLAALDYSCAEIMGYQPLKIPIIRDALNESQKWISSASEISYPYLKPKDLWIKDFKKVRIVQDIAFVKDKLPAPLYRMFRGVTVPQPFFDHKKCIRCGKCVDICSAEALSFQEVKNEKKITIIRDKCIQCYCCHEICPADAIRLKRTPFI